MKSVLLIDFDSKIPNYALMQLSSYYKKLSWDVTLITQTTARNLPRDADKVFCSVIFARNHDKAAQLAKWRPDIQIGGTGWDLSSELPPEVQICKPDYDLYSAELLVNRIKGIGSREMKMAKAKALVDAGIGFTSRGCIRKCGFCVVPVKEGALRSASEIRDIINPRSNVLILLDNNFTADPDCLEKLREIRERNLVINLSQGIDVRLVTPEIAKALSEVKHLKKLCYAWDLPSHENIVLKGIETLSKYIKKYQHMCYMLVGFNTTFEEDLYRFKKLTEIGVDPYCMVYNQKNDVRLRHFARWVNSRIYKTCVFEDYVPWVKAREKMGMFVEELFIDTFLPSIAEMVS